MVVIKIYQAWQILILEFAACVQSEEAIHATSHRNLYCCETSCTRNMLPIYTLSVVNIKFDYFEKFSSAIELAESSLFDCVRSMERNDS